MTQQRFRNLTLAMILVSLAAVAILILSADTVKKEANADRLLDDGFRIAQDVQKWKLRPSLFGGGSHPEVEEGDFTGLTPSQIWTRPGPHGRYRTTGGEFKLTVSRSGIVYITGCNDEYGNQVILTVIGTAGVDIGHTISEVDDCDFN